MDVRTPITAEHCREALSIPAAYALLGLQKGSSAIEVKKAYKELLRTEHPDRGGSATRFQSIVQAVDLALKDSATATSANTSSLTCTEQSGPTLASRAATSGNVASRKKREGRNTKITHVDPGGAAKTLGNSAFGAGDIKAAVASYSEAIKLSPDDAVLFSNRSAAYYKLGAHAQALEDAKRAVMLRPRWPKAHFRCGLAQSALQKYSQAAKSFRQAAALDDSLEEEIAPHLTSAETASSSTTHLSTLRGHSDTVYSIAFQPCHAPSPQTPLLIATASLDGTARLWDSSSGRCLRVLDQHHDKVTEVVWAPSGRLLATASLDKTVRLWDITTPLRIEGPTESSADCSQDSRRSCSSLAGLTGQATFLPGLAISCRRVLQGHTGRVTAMVFTSNGQRLATSSTDHSARLWDVSTGSCVHVMSGHRGIVTSIDLSPSEDLLASSSGDGSACVWSLRSGECVHKLEWNSGGVTHCVFTPRGAGTSGGSLLATCHLDTKQNLGRVLMWDVEAVSDSGRVPVRGHCKSFDGFKGRIEALDFRSQKDGSLLMAIGAADGSVAVHDVASAECHFRLLDVHRPMGRPKASAALYGLRFSPQGEYLATCGVDGLAKVWEADTGVLVQSLLGHKQWTKCLAWSPSGTMLATGSADRTACIWRTDMLANDAKIN